MKQINKNQLEGSGIGAANPFARSGLTRSPLRRSKDVGAGSCARSSSVGAPIHSPASPPVEILDGAWLMKAINQNKEGLPVVEVAEQQPGKIIDFASTKSYKMLWLRKSMDDGRITWDSLRLQEQRNRWKARKIQTPQVDSNAGKSNLSQVSWKAGKCGPENSGPPQIEGNRELEKEEEKAACRGEQWRQTKKA